MENTKQNVDFTEVAKFESLAHRWWDTQGEFKSLHDINSLRISYIDQHAHLSGRHGATGRPRYGYRLSRSSAGRGQATHASIRIRNRLPQHHGRGMGGFA